MLPGASSAGPPDTGGNASATPAGTIESMEEMSRALSILNSLAAMVTARLSGDSDGEDYLRQAVPPEDRSLYSQAAAVMLARSLTNEKTGRPSTPLSKAAALVRSGDTAGAYLGLASVGPIPLPDIVSALAESWLELYGDVPSAVRHGQEECSAYRAGTLQVPYA